MATFAGWRDEHGDDIEWVTGGYAFVAYREREETAFRRLLEVQHRHGLDIDWLDADELLARVPDLAPDGLRGGTFSPGDGHCSTLRASHALAEAARRAGVTFRFGERVTGLRVEHGRVQGVRTDRGEIVAPLVVNAAGGDAARVAALVGDELAVRTDLHEAAITEPVAPFLAPLVVDVRPGPGSANVYFYQAKTGQPSSASRPTRRSGATTSGPRARSCRRWRSACWRSCRGCNTSGCVAPGAGCTP